ncbi:MAG: accessory factor UbiK family protein [Gammaproteobacteria bacterium]
MDTKIIDDFAKKLADIIPKGAQDLQNDIEKNIRAIASSTFNKMDLVTREEFEVQKGVLARTRVKLEALEKKLTAMEQEMTEKD